MRREWIEMVSCDSLIIIARSPSMRREWIEMADKIYDFEFSYVSLHAEGVD